jgi:putative DNA methylase
VSDDRRLIEDLMPVAQINAATRREKTGGGPLHPTRLHRWWARRPLPAVRAAIYATLVRTDAVPEDRRSAEFFSDLCRSADAGALDEARLQVSEEFGGRPPKVLDMFAGGGAIPLEVGELGGEASAVELNPVAHLIELCSLDYPRRFGPSLGDDIQHWGTSWVDAAWDLLEPLYPALHEGEPSTFRQMGFGRNDEHGSGRQPIATIWARTVRCSNPSLPKHAIPLVRQTWLAKKRHRYIFLKPRVDSDSLRVDWEVVESSSIDELGFDPSAFSDRGRATCLHCGTAVDADYIKKEALAGRLGLTALAGVFVKSSGRGREYHGSSSLPLPVESDLARIEEELRVDAPTESLPEKLSGGMCTLYGLTRYCDLFTRRQEATLRALAQGIGEQYERMRGKGMTEEHAKAVCAYLALALDRVVERSNSLCVWHSGRETAENSTARQALPMTWDFPEANPFGGSSGDVRRYVENVAAIAGSLAKRGGIPADVRRASATELPYGPGTFDAVVTDPPYYDYIFYADLSDFFYVWLKRAIGELFPEHFSGELTPKRRELIAAQHRHGSDGSAREFYEGEMTSAFREVYRVLSQDGPLVCVYAHKTTRGWSALVEAMRQAGFTITEAWPIETELSNALKGGTASLASSIFLVARKRGEGDVGSYGDVLAELDSIVDERLHRLTEAGVSGSDLVVATMGAGLRAFTRHSSVELPNGEEVPAESFLEDVQSRVLNAVLGQVHGLSNGVGAIDPATRYYVIARYSFGYADIEFDEANNLARSAGVELDELTDGRASLAKLSKGKVHLCDYSERGEEPELGIAGDGDDSPLIDVLHGLLWRASNRRDELGDYTVQASFDPTKLRLVAQALQGRALRAEGENKPPEAQACERLLGAWKTLVDDNLLQR